MQHETVTVGEKHPVLPLRDIVVFPHMIVPLFVGRDKSVRALESAMADGKKVLLVTQKSAQQDDPTPGDLYDIGTLGTVLQLLKLPDGTVKVLVEGHKRVQIVSYTDKVEYFEAFSSEVEEREIGGEAIDGLMRACVSQFDQYVKLNRKIPPEIVASIGQIDSAAKLADTIASHLSLKIPDRQKLLESLNVAERLEQIFAFMEGEISVMEVEKRIRGRVKRQMEKTQREYYLNEQMRAIQKELNEGEDGLDELAELEEKIKKARMTKEAKNKATAELKKLRQMSPMSAEATVVRNYLDWMLCVPWNKKSKIIKDLKFAESVLEKDHYGLEKVKERILEYLAVQHRAGKVKGPIICLVGPPGVGKTSLGKSIAKSTGRNFVRMSLGGVRDESEIRGHRRTYIGSMPGRIVQGMKKAKTSNPLFLLDEIDKLAHDWRGDPAAALLEVLDPEQNNTFNDHYLEVDYDLSDVMFICTANTLDLPRPLLDRMEIIRVSGYTEDEKVEIARRHLQDKTTEANGLKKGEFSINDAALRHLIRYYTREAGVRNLERELSNLARKAIKEIMLGKKDSIAITPKNIEKYAGVPRYRYGQADEQDRIGCVTGLAWTEVGGDLLQIESVTFPGGKGKVSMTGKLGDVMKESIQVAEMIVKSRAPSLGIKMETLEHLGVHVHVPEGATPKDGPSAGIAMVTSIVSCLTGIAVRKDVAMTGEVDLLGQVLPIGGLKEKLLAALRGGITKVLIPKENVKDLAEIPDNVKKGLEIVPMTVITEVLSHALVRMPEPVDDKPGEGVTAKTAENKAKDVIHH
ncbi:MAG: endopeptidase La [Alphaproteobacteria bacterium]